MSHRIDTPFTYYYEVWLAPSASVRRFDTLEEARAYANEVEMLMPMNGVERVDLVQMPLGWKGKGKAPEWFMAEVRERDTENP